MKRILLVLPFVLAACGGVSTEPREGVASVAARMRASSATCLAPIGKPRVLTEVSRGFDLLGYNRCARIFSGPADGVDGSLDGKVWGDATYANDHLVMKWNAEWDRGNLENWSTPPYAAWEDNEWNGMLPDGSRWTEHFKTKWDASCKGLVYNALGTAIRADGETCIWGQFLIVMDQGMDPDHLHWWASHFSPTGYGN